jgi:phosphoesterase RecJ-like protein
MTTPYHRAAVYLRHAEAVVVGAHVNPDGDAIGSMLGLTIALRDAGIAAVPTLADSRPAPDTYEFLPGFDLLVEPSELETPDLFVALDTPDPARLGDAAQLAEDAENVIVIDHHPDNQEFGEVNVTDAAMAATGQMIWKLLDRLEVKPSVEVAQCLYVALMTDTGRFQFENTTAAALRDAAEMVDVGVAPSEMARLVYHNRSKAALDLDARVLSRVALANHDRVAWSFVEKSDYTETGARPEDTENLVDVVRALENIDVAMLIRVRSDEVRVNLRAKAGADVGAVAREFGGGGHAAAAGFTAAGTLDDVLPKVLAALPGAGG